jgi:Ca2+-binding RTX toxin-like protein
MAAPINGTNLDDNLTGTPGSDVINGLAGNDTIDGLEANDTLNGGPGADLLIRSSGSDTLLGGAGNDTLHPDTFEPPSFEPTDDRVRDVVDGGAGIDTAELHFEAVTAAINVSFAHPQPARSCRTAHGSCMWRP